MAITYSALKSNNSQMKSKSSRNTMNSTVRLLCNATLIITTLLANLVLSVDAIKCHQCNSHLDEDCIQLRLSTPRAQLDEQYLRECENHAGGPAFCRKTVVKIEATGEHRIVRSCGWINLDHIDKTNACYTADNEGYLQTICSCTEDGCNAAPGLANNWGLVFLGILSVVVVVMMRR